MPVNRGSWVHISWRVRDLSQQKWAHLPSSNQTWHGKSCEFDWEHHLQMGSFLLPCFITGGYLVSSSCLLGVNENHGIKRRAASSGFTTWFGCWSSCRTYKKWTVTCQHNKTCGCIGAPIRIHNRIIVLTKISWDNPEYWSWWLTISGISILTCITILPQRFSTIHVLEAPIHVC